MLEYDVQQTPRYSPWSQLAILLGLCGVGLLIGSVVSIFIVKALLHIPASELREALLKSENANLSRLLQFLTTFFLMAVPTITYGSVLSRKPLLYVGFNSAISGKQIFIIIGIVLLGLVTSATLSSINEAIPITKSAAAYFKGLEDEYNKEMMAIANMKTTQDYIISLLIIGLLPALFEEMLFRGALQPILISISKNVFAGILITSILFSAIHVSYYGFLPRIALGLIIGYIFYYSKNLWLSSITHFLYNAIGVTQLYVLSKNGKLSPDAMSEQTLPLYYGLFAAAALYIMFRFFKRESGVVVSMYNLKQH